MKPYSKKHKTNYSITRAILGALFGSRYQHLKKVRQSLNGASYPTRWRYNKAMRYLEECGKIKSIRKNDEIFIKLTKKGRVQTLLHRIQAEHGIKDQKWDGKWRLVIWDIPESSNNERNRIRYFLKNVGFQRLQQSVYIRPRPLPADAVQYLKESGLIRFIHFLRVDKIDDEKLLFKKFGLKHLRN